VPAIGVVVLPQPLGLLGVDAVLLVEAAGIDGVDLRVAVGGRVIVRMGVGELAELPSECDLGGMVEILTTEEDDFPAQKRILDRLERFRVKGLADSPRPRSLLRCVRTGA
jgi:hypothetical protein